MISLPDDGRAKVYLTLPPSWCVPGPRRYPRLIQAAPAANTILPSGDAGFLVEVIVEPLRSSNFSAIILTTVFGGCIVDTPLAPPFDTTTQDFQHPDDRRPILSLTSTMDSWQEEGSEFPTGLSSSSLYPAATATSIAPDDWPTFAFTSVPFMQTCTTSKIEWEYVGSSEQVTLEISRTTAPNLQVGTPQMNFVPLPSASVNAEQGEYIWQTVDYASGWYVIRATSFNYDISVLSEPFAISDGADTSCLDSPSDVTAITTSLYSSPSPPSVIDNGSSPHIEPIPAPFESSPSKMISSSVPEQRHKGAVIAGGVIASIAVLGAIILACICLQPRNCRRRYTFASKARERYSAKWPGLSYSDSDLQASPALSMNEKSLPSAIKVPDPALPRLEPNRRKPSIYALYEQAPAPRPVPRSQTPQASLRVSEDALARANSITRRGDSPTSLASPYCTRKPVPPLYLDQGAERSPTTEGPRSPNSVDLPYLTSPVPSSATSRMYRIRESGTSSQAARPYQDGEEGWRARASSIIDPHQFGAMKTMHTVVPDVPPLPSR